MAERGSLRWRRVVAEPDPAFDDKKEAGRVARAISPAGACLMMAIATAGLK